MIKTILTLKRAKWRSYQIQTGDWVLLNPAGPIDTVIIVYPGGFKTSRYGNLTKDEITEIRTINGERLERL